jgi:hypothetical protein
MVPVRQERRVPTIAVTAVDNELYVNLFSATQSYEICHIISGFDRAIDVTITVNQGAYARHDTLEGLSVNLGPESNYTISVPAGGYELVATGINWQQGKTNFAFSIDKTPFSYTNGDAPAGVTWKDAPHPVTIQQQGA